jgi:hypothetical protein
MGIPAGVTHGQMVTQAAAPTDSGEKPVAKPTLMNKHTRWGCGSPAFALNWSTTANLLYVDMKCLIAGNSDELTTPATAETLQPAIEFEVNPP